MAKVEEQDLEDLDEDFYDDEDTVGALSETEKDFEQMFRDKNVIYFLESSGNWWKNTFKSEDDAKKVLEAFTKE